MWLKGNNLLNIFVKPCKLIMLCMTFLHCAQRTIQNQPSKTWSLGLSPSEKSRLREQVLEQMTCLFHTALVEEGKTSDRHCLTLKPACLPVVNLCLIYQYRCPHACLSLETFHCLQLTFKPANGIKAWLPWPHQMWVPVSFCSTPVLLVVLGCSKWYW